MTYRAKVCLPVAWRDSTSPLVSHILCPVVQLVRTVHSKIVCFFHALLFALWSLSHSLLCISYKLTQDLAGYCRTLAEQGLLFSHWELIRDLFVDALKASPYMEAYELQNMELGTDSAAYRFFTLHVVKPMTMAIAAMEEDYDDPANAQMVCVTSGRSGDVNLDLKAQTAVSPWCQSRLDGIVFGIRRAS